MTSGGEKISRCCALNIALLLLWWLAIYWVTWLFNYISNYFRIVVFLERYVAWNLHEPKEGVYDFNGSNDVESFIRMAQSAGLLVIVRAGGLMHWYVLICTLGFWVAFLKGRPPLLKGLCHALMVVSQQKVDVKPLFTIYWNDKESLSK